MRDKIKERKELNIAYNSNKRRKLKEEHKEYIDSLVQTSTNQKLTAWKINERLQYEFSDLNSVSDSTIIRWLKKDLHWSFKKLERKPAPSTTSNSTRLVLEGAVIQKRILELDAEVIFIDEFSVNSRHHEFSGWTKVGQKGYVITETKEFSMSFICGISNKRILGLMGVKETTTSDIIVIYLKSLFEALQRSNNGTNCECVVIWDNASVHSNSLVRNFIKSSKLRVISIPAYSPFLNPAEKLINAIKMKIRKAHGEGR